MTPEDLHVTITPDAPRTPVYDALWRKLLRPIEPELADCLARAEGIATPEADQQEERRPCPRDEAQSDARKPATSTLPAPDSLSRQPRPTHEESAGDADSTS